MNAPPWVAPFRAALDRSPPPWHVAFANATPEALPQVRDGVLRGLDDDGTAWFHADERSDRSPYLRFNPNVEFLASFDGGAVQVRLAGRATVHGASASGHQAALRQQEWSELPALEQSRYLGGPPGRPLGPPPLGSAPPREAPRDFVLVSVEVTRVDWLTHGEPDERVVYRRLGAVWIDEPVYP